MRWRAALASTVAAAVLTSCAGGQPNARPTPATSSSVAASSAQPSAAITSSRSPSPPPSPSASRTTGVQHEQRMLATVQALLARRAEAVLRHDKAGFLADLDPGNPGLRRRQARFFDNLAALPLRTFTLQAPGATWPSDFAAEKFRRTAYIPYVEQGLQLRGFDPVPVTSNYALTFAEVEGVLRIVSDDDLADRESDRARNAPWDTTRIVVRRSKDALGIFDEQSQTSAGRIMSWTEESLAAVRRDVPEDWPGDVVVYALSSERLLRRMGTRFLDRAAIAFPVFDDSDNPTRRVATRVLINPKYLPRNEIEGSYLLTHEITHVALARTSGATPTWVQEGMADYVATRGADPSRWLPTDATAARARKGADAMPASTFFGDDDPGFDYDLSLAACAYLARRFGEDRLWAFLDRLTAAGRADGDSEGHVDPVLRDMFHLDGTRLAGHAARLIVQRVDG
jgi:hypothetical protein